jgi:predicted transcriptional regulator
MNNVVIQVELSPQHITALDELASYLGQSRDSLIAQAIAIMQLVHRGIVTIDYNWFPHGVAND